MEAHLIHTVVKSKRSLIGPTEHQVRGTPGLYPYSIHKLIEKHVFISTFMTILNFACTHAHADHCRQTTVADLAYRAATSFPVVCGAPDA